MTGDFWCIVLLSFFQVNKSTVKTECEGLPFGFKSYCHWHLLSIYKDGFLFVETENVRKYASQKFYIKNYKSLNSKP